MTASAAKFEKIAARITRGSTDGEKAAARNVARTMIENHGLRAVLPSHPLVIRDEEQGFISEWDLVEVCEKSVFDADEVTRFAFYAALPYYGAKTVGRALAIIRARQKNGWLAGAAKGRAGEWHGGSDLRFLNVSEWGFEQAFKRAVASEGADWTDADRERFVASRVESIAQHLREQAAA